MVNDYSSIVCIFICLVTSSTFSIHGLTLPENNSSDRYVKFASALREEFLSKLPAGYLPSLPRRDISSEEGKPKIPVVLSDYHLSNTVPPFSSSYVKFCICSIPSNPSVASKTDAKLSTSSIEKSSERDSPMPTFRVDVLDQRQNKRNSLPCWSYK